MVQRIIRNAFSVIPGLLTAALCTAQIMGHRW
jgi:hypothetical protein